MLRFIIITLFTLLVFSNVHLRCQGEQVKYTFDFKFEEGIYLTFEEFKFNNPSLAISDIIRIVPKRNDNNYISRPIRKIYYYSKDGEEQFLKIYDIWGICNRKSIFIRLDNKLNKFIQIGTLTYFIQNKKDVTTRDFTDGSGGVGTANPHSLPQPSELPEGPHKNHSEYLKYNLPCILDFETGEVLYFTRENFIKKLKNDRQLYEEYISITDTKQQYYKMLQFLRKYNEKTPIYFPSITGNFGANKKCKRIIMD